MSKHTCTATNRQGKRCGRAPIVGGTVCASHGGKAPQVEAAAHRRTLDGFVGPALVEMRAILDDDKTPASVRLGAIKDILDRTGFKPVTQIQVMPTEEQILGWLAELDDE